jgi:hypothetical protein
MAMGCCYGDFFDKAKPYLAMISLQFGYAGMNVITKVSLNHGMSHYVLVVYRHAFATVSIAPFALILERYYSLQYSVSLARSVYQLAITRLGNNIMWHACRKVRPNMTWSVFLQIFVLALLGLVPKMKLCAASCHFWCPDRSNLINDFHSLKEKKNKRERALGS